MNLPTALKQFRTELNIKQKEMAEMLNAGVSTVNRWEKGKFLPTKQMGNRILQIAEEKNVSQVCIENLKLTLFPGERIPSEINDLRDAHIDRINQLVNDSSNGVVVVDIDSFELLYINNKATEVAESTLEDAKNRKCYELFMHRDTPCPNCHLFSAQTNEMSEWEYSSKFTGHHYLVRGKKVDWAGRKAQIKYITDITETYNLQKVSAERQKMLKYAARFANMRVFEIDLPKKRATLLVDFNDMNFFPITLDNYPDSVFEKGYVDSRYETDYRNMVQKVIDGKKQAEEKICTMDQKGSFRQCLYRINVVNWDENGKPVKAVCSVQIIDG